MAINARPIPTWLSTVSFSLNKSHAAAALNKTMPILLIGMIEELLSP